MVCIVIAQLYFDELIKPQNNLIYDDLIPLYSRIGSPFIERMKLDRCRNNEYSLDDLCYLGTFFETIKRDLNNTDLITSKMRKRLKPYFSDLNAFLKKSIERSSNELKKFDKQEYAQNLYERCKIDVPIVNKKLKLNRENYYYDDDFLNSLDVPLQRKGWEWLEDKDNIKNVTTTYPKEEWYYYHINHPEYKLKLPYVYDKNDNLVFVEELERTPHIDETYQNKLNKLLARQDFLANKYNVQHDKKDVVIRIKKDIGLLPEGHEGLRNIAATGSRNGKTRLNGYLNIMHSFSVQDEAEKFLKQSETDHQDDLSYVYEIKRVDNVSFLIRYLNSKGESSITVKIRYFKRKDDVDLNLELLPTVKEQVVKIREPDYYDWPSRQK